MTEHTYTATIAGSSLTELHNNLRAMVDAMNGQNASVTDYEPQGVPGGAQQQAAEPPLLPKRRGRPPASQAGNGAAAAASPAKPVSQLRQEATDILKACWGVTPDGAEKVIALQQQFGVKRFAEVGDDRIQALHQAAVALQNELAGGTPAEVETGPF